VKEKTPKPKESPKFAENQQWKHKKTGKIILLGYCTKKTAQYEKGTRMLRATTLLDQYELVPPAAAPKK